MPQSYAFTVATQGRPNVLISPCKVTPAVAGPEDFHQFQAIWDTGSTGSLITQGVVDQCGLKPIGKTKFDHAGIDDKPDETEVYLVNIKLPNNVTVKDVQVGRGGFNGGDVLVGMDIINSGDFAITHMNSKTKFTFQIPPQADIDFVKEQPIPPPRNRAERRKQKHMKRP